MCVVSMIMDHGGRRWPNPAPDAAPAVPPIPAWQFPPPPSPFPSEQEIKEFRDLLEQAKKIDKVTGQPDCEDPEKTDWMEEMEKRVSALEGKKEPQFFDFGLHLETLRDVAKSLKSLHAAVGGGTLNAYAEQLQFIANLMEKQLET